MNEKYGKLYIVATPIGNLNDMTFRAIEVLKSVSLIACEDTRHTQELLNHFEITTKTTSYHEHNKYEKAKSLVEELKSGNDIAVVTDAGTPIVSDPGDELVKMAIAEGIDIFSIPGACAAINALVLSGLDARSFVFEGFLYEDNKKRKEQLKALEFETRTIIFYVSPHNLLKDLKEFSECFGDDRQISVSRELTKKFEETRRGSIKEIYDYFSTNDIKGEFVVVVKGLDKEILEKEKIDSWSNMTIEEHEKYYEDKGFTPKEAMKMVARDRGVDKNEIYKVLKIN